MATVKCFFNEIESICECNICCVDYDEEKHVPRVLPCQHTFCTDCLIKHCKRQKLKCPFCNQEHNVRNGDVKVFPKDNTRRDLKELLSKFSQSLCGICQQHDRVKYFCATCNIRLCRGCFKKRKTSVCSTHSVDIIDDSEGTPDTSLESIENHPKSVCLLTGHEKNELKFFCSENSCSMPVCANCIVESHKTHDTTSVRDEYASRTNCMQGSCERTREKIARAKNLLEVVEKEYASMKYMDRKGKKSLAKVANAVIKNINDYQETDLQMILETFQSYLNMLERRKEQLQYFIENATECCAISEEALTGNNAVAFLSVEKTLTEKLNCFKQSDVDRPLDPISIPIADLQKRISRMTRDGHEINYRRSYLAFESSQTSLMCLTADRRVASNTPIENTMQTCGSKRSRYIFNGAFTNTSFLYGTGDNFIYRIDVSKIKRYYPGQTLFEFGISKGSIHRRNIVGPSSLGFYGWYLNILSKTREFALVNTEGLIIYRGVISVFDEESFTFRVDFKPNRTVTLEIRNKNGKSYEKLDETRSIKGKKLGFVKTWYSYDAHISIRILNDNIAFNRSTLYPHLYTSTNNKTISNKQLPSLIQKQIVKGNNYQDIMLLNCRNKCVYVLEFKANSPHDRKLFSLVLTNSKFLPSAYYNVSLFSYVACDLQWGFNWTYPSYCSSVHNERSSYLVEMKSNEWHSLTIMVNRKRHSLSLLLEQKLIEIQNGSIFDSGTPVLRWSVDNMHDSVEIRLGDREDLNILKWFMNYFVFYDLIGLLSWIPISSNYIYPCICLMITCFDIIINRNRIERRADDNAEGIYIRRRIY